MGGLGSGQYQSWDAKDLCEETKCLNLFKLHKEGVITPGGSCSGSFTVGTSTLGFVFSKNHLRLTYRFTTGTYAGQDMDYSIQLCETHPHFGGARQWFLCPTCGRRAGKLYLARLKFECRTCADLAYRSTREMSLEKIYAAILRQDQRLQRKYERLGLSAPD